MSDNRAKSNHGAAPLYNYMKLLNTVTTQTI